MGGSVEEEEELEEEEEEELEEEEEEEETSDFGIGGNGSSEDENRIMEWEIGLPSADDLMPLSQSLIPLELASAFSISPEPCRSALDVSRASQDTLATIRRHQDPSFSSNGLKSLPHFDFRRQDPTEDSGNSARQGRRPDAEEADSPPDDQSARTPKRPRLVWTPQLHKRFVDVVAHLGIKNAVPKTIMELMNVEGLTRENVASHLQKYRLYLKRMEGDGPSSSSDHLFATTPVPQSFHDPAGGGSSGQFPTPMVPYGAAAAAAAQVMPMPVLGMAHGNGHMGRLPSVCNQGVPTYHGFESHPYNMFREQQKRGWPGNEFGSVMSYPHMTPSNK